MSTVVLVSYQCNRGIYGSLRNAHAIVVQNTRNYNYRKFGTKATLHNSNFYFPLKHRLKIAYVEKKIKLRAEKNLKITIMRQNGRGYKWRVPCKQRKEIENQRILQGTKA